MDVKRNGEAKMVTLDQEQWNPDAGMDLLWGTRERASRGPKASLSLEEIARAGIAIADAEGLGALSMRRIAEELGFTTMSLYRHVPGKTELLAVMIDTAIGEALPIPAVEGGWRPQLAHWAYQNLALLRRHPWLLVRDLPGLTGPQKMAWIEAGMQAIADTGLSGGDLLEVVLCVYVYVQGSAQVFLTWQQEEMLSWSSPSPLMRRIASDDRFPILKAILASGAFDPAAAEAVAETANAESFAFGLQRMLDGIAAYIAERCGDLAIGGVAIAPSPAPP